MADNYWLIIQLKMRRVAERERLASFVSGDSDLKQLACETGNEQIQLMYFGKCMKGLA